MTRIGIDARMAQHTGIGRYLRNVVRHAAPLAPDITFVVFVNPSQERSWLPTAGNVEVRELPREIGIYSLAEHTTLPKALRRAGLDLVHFPSFNVPRFCSLPQVVTIHDLIYLLFPESCPSRLAAWYARKMLKTASGRARFVITISEHGREDAVRYLGVPREKGRATPLAADEMVELAGRVQNSDALLARFGPLRPYLLYVGNLAPHKNLAGLLAAFVRVRESHPALKLVVVGKRTHHFPPVQARVAELGLDQSVCFTDHVTDEELVALYKRAEMLVHPSLYEGFGLTVLEAFACGTPVVSSNRASLPEVIGDAALLANPENPNEMTKAIQDLLGDPTWCAALAQKGHERVKQFSWDRTARETLAVYREAMERP